MIGARVAKSAPILRPTTRGLFPHKTRANRWGCNSENRLNPGPIVEDHNVVRQGLAALLNMADGLEVVGEAADGVEAIAQFRKHQPDITLMDLRLPRMSGVDAIERIRMETPQARFIVLTTYDGDEDIYRALKAGARAYLLKGMTSEDLIGTIRTVHAARSHIPTAIAETTRRARERCTS